MKRSERRGKNRRYRVRSRLLELASLCPPANNVFPRLFIAISIRDPTHGPVTRYNLEDDSASKHGYSRIILASPRPGVYGEGKGGGGSFAGEREIGHEDSIRSGGDPASGRRSRTGFKVNSKVLARPPPPPPTKLLRVTRGIAPYRRGNVG